MFDPRIINGLQNLQIDTSGMSDSDVVKLTVDFYIGRIAQCIIDQCPEAANAYLEKMRKDSSINSSTKLEILHEYMKLV